MRKFLMLPLAGLLVIGGATAVVAAPDAVDDTVGQVSNAATVAGSFLSDVLADLVTDGVINQQQADAIVEAVDTRAEEKRAEMEQMRELVTSFLEDGVISAEELEQLPADHPWRNLDEFLADGQLTLDELQQLRGPFGRGHGPRGGPGGHSGPGTWFVPPDGDPGTDTDTDSGTDSSTSS